MTYFLKLLVDTNGDILEDKDNDRIPLIDIYINIKKIMGPESILD
jgi:hypothetical protein